LPRSKRGQLCLSSAPSWHKFAPAFLGELLPHAAQILIA
jgi:hypothetical protein